MCFMFTFFWLPSNSFCKKRSGDTSYSPFMDTGWNLFLIIKEQCLLKTILEILAFFMGYPYKFKFWTLNSSVQKGTIDNWCHYFSFYDFGFCTWLGPILCTTTSHFIKTFKNDGYVVCTLCQIVICKIKWVNLQLLWLVCWPIFAIIFSILRYAHARLMRNIYISRGPT